MMRAIGHAIHNSYALRFCDVCNNIVHGSLGFVVNNRVIIG